MGKNIYPILNKSCCVLFFGLLLVFFGLATWSNSDLLGPPGFLFMDERFVFDYVKRILDAPSINELWWAIADGGDHRYGRIFYYTAAIFAWLPYLTFSDAGLIFGIRFSLVILMLASYVILSLGLLKTWPGRLISLFLLLCLPFTTYYLTMPKPEPVLLLMLALFLVVAKRNRFHFGAHWIFLGCAYGAKISAAPFVGVAGIISIMASFLDRIPIRQFASQALKGCGFFMLGFVIAVPFLIHPKPKNIDAYLGWTWRGTGHGADDISVNWKIWLSELLTESQVTNNYYSSAEAKCILVLIFVIICLNGVFWTINRKPEKWAQAMPWFYLALALSAFVPIILFVQRLWGIYLHPGFCLGIVSLVAISEATVKMQDIKTCKKGWICLSLIAVTATILFLSVNVMPKVYLSYKKLASRTKTTEHLNQAENYKKIQKILADIQKTYFGNRKPLTVYYDPWLYKPDSSSQFTIMPFWSYDIPYRSSPDLIVYDYKNTLCYLINHKALPTSNVKEFQMLSDAKNKFSQNVDIKNNRPDKKNYHLFFDANLEFGIAIKSQ